jgi:uncharacterized damage-inducible protein DinB
MSISQTLLPEFDQEMASTRKILNCVPEDKYSWKPHEKSMTLGRLASHVAELPHWAVETMNRETLELTPGMKPWIAASQAGLLAGFDRNVAEARALIAGASDADLAVEWSLIFGGHKVLTMPRGAVLRSVVMNHLIHHRAQLGVYLRLNDVAIPGMYGPSADENKMFGSANA